ncbi:MAG TPA: hypothetical protein VFT77_02240 [Reyranella sp.]|jgi:hypothetical protein|nr:hypothetical protein [Reyranella sp.]
MNSMRLAIPVLSGLLLVAPQTFGQTRDHDEASEKTVQLSQVPKAARDAAQKELGAMPTEAKMVSGTNPQEYELEAKDRSGKEVGVHVHADGTVVKKEKDKD